MEPLFLSVICGCNAGLLRDALNEVYIPRIQRGKACFAANVLGARGPLLSALVHFFEQGNWGSLVETSSEEHGLTVEDQLFILTQAGQLLTATRGMGAMEARTCYERLASLSHSLGRPLLLHVALIGLWRYSLLTDKLTATMQIAKRVYSLAQEQNDAALMVGAYRTLAATAYFLGDFEAARQYATHGLQIWRSEGVPSPVEEFYAPPVICLVVEALSEWHLGEIASSKANMAEAISLAKELNDLHALVLALYYRGLLGSFEGDSAEVERYSSDLLELSRLQNFGTWLPGGAILRAWARSVSGETIEGISRLEDEIKDYRVAGQTLIVPYYLALKAEALYLANRTSDAVEAIRDAEGMAERFEERWWCAELHRLRGVFLAAMGVDEGSIEAAFSAAIRIANEQKSISLAKRAEATYAEYCRQKASASGGRGIRLSLW